LKIHKQKQIVTALLVDVGMFSTVDDNIPKREDRRPDVVSKVIPLPPLVKVRMGG